eukprot:TRINITY_DN3508_c0_g1_i1.p1 TRINITY_DN3508_c0_g1~~TRINITY_DN3508_c0_g1_i1.p1  ORF type:complete len:491 (-),score=83.84 TRINITY_DN3508_c0_g1_i1:250-1722(-)
MHTSTDDREGRLCMIGPYALGRTIGKGSFGKVKVGCDVRTGEKVAVKMIDMERISDAKMKERTKREIAIMKIARHPNIVKLIDVIETNEKLYMILEYVNGGELYDYIATTKRVSEPRAKKIFREIVDAISYCHNFDIVHRDLKPENILLDRRKGVKLIDFGLANVITGDSMLSSRCGSPYYVAPETILGQDYGPAADVWSLGVILYTMLTGDTPFADPNVKQLLGKIVQGHFDIPPYVSKDARDLLEQMLQTDPHKRPQLDVLRAHPWLPSMPHHEQTEGMTPTLGPLDEEIVRMMMPLGWPASIISEHVHRNPQSGIARMYRMLLFRKRIHDTVMGATPSMNSNQSPSQSPCPPLLVNPNVCLGSATSNTRSHDPHGNNVPSGAGNGDGLTLLPPVQSRSRSTTPSSGMRTRQSHQSETPEILSEPRAKSLSITSPLPKSPNIRSSTQASAHLVADPRASPRPYIPTPKRTAVRASAPIDPFLADPYYC